MTRWQHGWLAVTTLPLLIFNPGLRSLFAEARAFCRSLPLVLQGPLLVALDKISADSSRGLAADSQQFADESTVRALADLAALFERRSPLGLCLRRSLTRYFFLRRLGVPVVLQFGAKFVAGQPDRAITGHAWLTLNGQPYYEADENFRGFTVIFAFPKDTLA